MAMTLDEKINLINEGHIDQLDISEVIALLGDLGGNTAPNAQAALKKAVERVEAHNKEITEKLNRMTPPVVEEDPITISKENLEKNSNLLDALQQKSFEDKEEFKDTNKLLDKIEFESKNGMQSFMDAVKLKTYSDCITIDGLDETKYIQALKTNIETGIYALAVNQAAGNAGYNPQASKEQIKATLDQISSRDATKGKFKIGVDNFMGFVATTAEAAEKKGNSLLKKFGNIPAVAKFSSKLKSFDEKMAKRYGKNYARAKGVVKFVSNAGMGVGIAAIAGLGMGGLAVVGAYTVGASLYGLNKQYRNEAEKYDNSFSNWASNNKLAVFKSSAMCLVGVATAGLAVSQIGANVAGAMGANVETFKAAVPYATKAKALLGYSLFATRNVIDMGVAAYQDMGTGENKNLKRAAINFGKEALMFGIVAGTTMGIAAAHGCQPTEYVNDTIKEPETPAPATEQTLPQRGWILPGIVPETPADDVKIPLAPVDPNVPVDATTPTTPTPAEEFDCGCGNEPTGPCADKILAQQNVGHNDTDIKFWEDRANRFMKPEEIARLEARIDGGCIDLDKMPGIDTKQELIYKYAIMRENNLVDERTLVNWLECGKLDDLQHKEIANAMNSYDNRGNPLCWTPTVVEKPQVQVQEAAPVVVQEEAVVMAAPAPEAEPVVEVPAAEELKTYSLHYSEESTLLEKVNRQDYDGLKPFTGLNTGGEISFDSGAKIDYVFENGALDIKGSQIPMDAYAQSVAQHMDGFAEDPNKAAMQLIAVAEVYNDMEYKVLSGEEIPGAQEWLDDKKAAFGAIGLNFDEENMLVVNPDVDKAAAIEAYNAAKAAPMVQPDLNPNEVEKVNRQDYDGYKPYSGR